MKAFGKHGEMRWPPTTRSASRLTTAMTGGLRNHQEKKPSSIVITPMRCSYSLPVWGAPTPVSSNVSRQALLKFASRPRMSLCNTTTPPDWFSTPTAICFTHRIQPTILHLSVGQSLFLAVNTDAAIVGSLGETHRQSKHRKWNVCPRRPTVQPPAYRCYYPQGIRPSPTLAPSWFITTHGSSVLSCDRTGQDLRRRTRHTEIENEGWSNR
ncbi:hypothetical protein QBC45DRAFT_461797 [Copromyces sp. CBS 386.78]|nr:hypothetical protein QBC45DRAFT_461797 [Copromyces sp. CBS 386.78]